MKGRGCPLGYKTLVLWTSYRWVQGWPSWMRTTIAEQPLWKWLGAVGVLAGALLFLRLMVSVSRRFNRNHPFLQAVAMALVPALVLLLTPWMIHLLLVQLNLTGSPARLIEIGGVAIHYLAGAWIAWRLAPVVAETIISTPQIPTESVDAHLIRIVARLLGLVAGAFLLAHGADQLGVPVYGIVAGLGVGGLAIALAAQPSIENLIGGFSLFADKPVRVGDFCQYGNQTGEVESIGIRSTRIRRLDRLLTTIPNAELSKMAVVNYTMRDKTLLQTELGLRYETTPDQLRFLLIRLRELLEGMDTIETESVRVRFLRFADFSLNVEVFCYVLTADRPTFLTIQEDVFLRIMDLVAEAGTGFAFPSSTLYLGKDGGLDKARAQAAEQQVAAWRSEKRELFS